MRLVAKIKEITYPVKLTASVELLPPIENKYKSPLSSDLIKDADKWFDEIGLRDTTVKYYFLTECTGPKNMTNPRQGEVLNNEIAIRLFILMLFSDTNKILTSGPQNYDIPQSLINERGRADQALILVEDEMSKELGSKHHYDKPLNIKFLKEKYDPKGFFDEVYDFLKNNIAKWSIDSVPSEDAANMKNLRDEGFNKMKLNLSTDESENYIKNLKENYLNELNEIIKFCEKTFKKEIQRGEISIEVKNKITWKQTKALMNDPKGDIRKYIALKKWTSAFLRSALKTPYRKEIAKALGCKNITSGSIYKDENLFNYLYTNESVRYNSNNSTNIFLKPENFQSIQIDGSSITKSLSGIMDWIKGNYRTPQISRRYYQGRELTAEDRTADGRFSEEVWSNSEEINYTEGEIIISNNIPMGLSMFNMVQHNPTTGSDRRYQHPTQYEIEKMVESYTFDNMQSAQTHYHSFISEFRKEQIQYEEKNSIIKDYRSGQKYGYYWAVLNTTSSDEESKRMGHCGSDGFGDLFSLRTLQKDSSISNASYRNIEFWRGTSWVTASVSKNGHIRQCKTLKNARPTDPVLLEKIVDLLSSEISAEYSKVLPFTVKPLHKKTLKLYNGKTIDLEPYCKPTLIQPFFGSINPGFNTSGYIPERDFHISDLSNDLLKKFYEARPDFFAWTGLESENEVKKIEERLIAMYEAERLEAEKIKEQIELEKKNKIKKDDPNE